MPTMLYERNLLTIWRHSCAHDSVSICVLMGYAHLSPAIQYEWNLLTIDNFHYVSYYMSRIYSSFDILAEFLLSFFLQLLNVYVHRV